MQTHLNMEAYGTLTSENITCQAVEESVICNGTTYTLPEPILTYMDAWFWIYIGMYVALVLFAGEY